jgi:hypothetical protein
MSTHSNEGDTSHLIPDWEQACKKAEARVKAIESAWQDAELRADKAEARVRELEAER